MITAKEIFEEELSGEPLTQESVIEVIKNAQIEAIEETCKRCSIEARISYDYSDCGNTGSEYPPSPKVDKISILKVADKMKEELE